MTVVVREFLLNQMTNNLPPWRGTWQLDRHTIKLTAQLFGRKRLADRQTILFYLSILQRELWDASTLQRIYWDFWIRIRCWEEKMWQAKRKEKKINGRMCTAEINKSRKGVMRSNNLHTKKKRREKCVRRKEKNCASCQVTSAWKKISNPAEFQLRGAPNNRNGFS